MVRELELLVGAALSIAPALALLLSLPVLSLPQSNCLLAHLGVGVCHLLAQVNDLARAPRLGP